LPVIVADDIRDAPGGRPVAVTADAAGAHRGLDLLGRLAEIRGRRSELDHRHPALDEPLREIGRRPRVRGDGFDAEAAPQIDDVLFDRREVGFLAGGDDQVAPPRIRRVARFEDRGFVEGLTENATRYINNLPVAPAKAGGQGERRNFDPWIPDCAGMTI
jgi:hypothetical protein